MHRRTSHGSLRTLRTVVLSLAMCFLFWGAGTLDIASAHSYSTIHDVLVVGHDNGTNPSNATKFWFSVPKYGPTGWVEYIFENHGTQEHEMQLFHIKSGHSANDLFKVLSNPNVGEAVGDIANVAEAVGGSGGIMPGQRQDTISWVEPGQYVVACFMTTPKGVPHFLLGMFQSFWAVSGARAGVDYDESTTNGHPSFSGTIWLGNYFINMPHQATRAGFHVFKVVNTSPNMIHQVQLSRLPNGVHPTRAQVLTCFNTPSKCAIKAQPVDVGGFDGISPHMSGYVEVWLQPGEYLAACFIPGPNGMPHAAMGMFELFTVK